MLTSDAYVCSVLQSDTFPYSKPPINFDNEFSKTNFIYFAAYLEECKNITVPKKKIHTICKSASRLQNMLAFIGVWRILEEIQVIDIVVPQVF